MRLKRRTCGGNLLALGCVLALINGAEASGPMGAPPGMFHNQTSVSFIDSALPMSQYRVKWDSFNNLTRPTRAEFFWPAPGPTGRPFAERSVDYQELRNYFEVACHDGLSFFVEMPVRFLNPEINPNTAGAGDLNAGMKLLFFQTAQGVVTGQFRAHAPTGSGERGLGRDLVVLEPGILMNHRVHEWVTLESEVKYWLPLDGSPLAGDVIQYGLGVVVGKQNPCGFWATPTAEFFGWVPLKGQEQFLTEDNTLVTQSVRGRNVVAGLFGGRVGHGECVDVYGGYGVRLGGAAWFEDMWRLELRFRF